MKHNAYYSAASCSTYCIRVTMPIWDSILQRYMLLYITYILSTSTNNYIYTLTLWRQFQNHCFKLNGAYSWLDNVFHSFNITEIILNYLILDL